MTTQSLEEETTKPERRKFLRRKFRGKIEIEWGSAMLTGDVRDIGPQGLFVELLSAEVGSGCIGSNRILRWMFTSIRSWTS